MLEVLEVLAVLEVLGVHQTDLHLLSGEAEVTGEARWVTMIINLETEEAIPWDHGLSFPCEDFLRDIPTATSRDRSSILRTSIGKILEEAVLVSSGCPRGSVEKSQGADFPTQRGDRNKIFFI